MKIDEQKLLADLDSLDFVALEDADEGESDDGKVRTEGEVVKEETGAEEEGKEKDSGQDGDPRKKETDISKEDVAAAEPVNDQVAVTQESLDAITELAKVKTELAELKAKQTAEPLKEETPKEFEHTPAADILGDQDPYDLVRDPSKFNAFLGQFEKKIVEATYKTIMGQLPQVVQVQAKQQQTYDTMVSKFYSDNEDLVPLKPYVAQVATMVASEMPAAKAEDVLNETAIRIRKYLKLPVPKTGTEPAKDEFDPDKQQGKGPNGVKNRRNGPSGKINKLQAELDEL